MATYRTVRQVFYKTRGLFTNANPNLLQGDLLLAENVVIRKSGLIEPSRSYKQLETSGTFAYNTLYLNGWFVVGTVNGQQNPSSTIYLVTGSGTVNIYLVNNSTIQFSPSETYDSALSPTSGNRTRYMQGLGATYVAWGFTGPVKRIVLGESFGASVMPNAGVPRATDPTLTGVTTTNGFLLNNTGCAYRYIFGRVDLNNTLIIGAPSGNVQIYNTSGNAQTVTFKAFLPTELTAYPAGTWNYYVYRTDVTVSGVGLATIPSPGDQCRLVYQAAINATDISNGFVSFTDVYPESVPKGAELYTNPNQGNIIGGSAGIAGANGRPPGCRDVALYRNVAYYASTVSKHRTRLQMLGIPTQMAIQSISAPASGQQTYTFLAGVNLTGITSACLLSVTGSTGGSNDGNWPVVSVAGQTIVVTSNNIAQAGAAGNAMVGHITFGARSYDAIYGAESVGSRRFQVTTAGTGQQNIALTMASLARMVNQDTTPPFNLFSLSGPDDPAGIVQVEEASIGGSSISISALGNDFAINKWLPALSTAVATTNDKAVHRLYYSKTAQLDHVPVGNYFDIGKRDAAILRTIASRDSIFILKQDGIWKLQGDPNLGSVPVNVSYSLFLLQPDLATICDNVIYAWCNSGIFAIADWGIRRISVAISDTCNKVAELIGNGYFYYCSSVGSTKEKLIYFYASMTSVNPGAGNPFVIDLTYAIDTDSWTGRIQGAQAASPPDPGQHMGCAQGEELGGLIYRFGPFNNSAFASTPNNMTMVENYSGQFEPTNSGANMSSASGIAGFSSPTTLGAAASLPGDRFWFSISANNQGAGTITSTSGPQTAGLGINTIIVVPTDAAPGQSLIGGQQYNMYYKITASTGGATPTLTLQQYIVDQSDISVWPFTNGMNLYFLGLRGTGILVQWHPFYGSRSIDMDQFQEAFVELDQNSTAQNTRISVATDLNQDLGTSPADTSYVNTATKINRVFIPPTLQKARKLSLRISNNEPAKLLNIIGIGYVYRSLSDPHTVE